MSTTTVPVKEPISPASRRKSVLLVFACTVLGAAAQILIKKGMDHVVLEPLALMTNFALIAGYTLYGLNTVMMVLALKDGELSQLYPIIAMTYVWVAILSYTMMGDIPNWKKNVGIAIIVIGVAVIGRGGRK